MKSYIFDLSDGQWEDFFHENGFVVIRGIYSLEECAGFLVLLKSCAEEGFPAIHNIERDPPEGKGLLQAENIYKKKEVVAVLDRLCGSEVVELGNQTLFKEAGSRWAGQAWNPHQDNSYPKTPNGEYTTTNAFLSDADRENGGMYIYPQSHSEGLLSFKRIVSYRENPQDNPGNIVVVPEKYRDKKIDLEVLAGDVLFLHGHVIHGSYPNASPTRSRPLFSVSYVPRGTKFISGKNNKRREKEVR